MPVVENVDAEDDGGMGFDNDEEEDPQDKQDTDEIKQTVTGAV